MAPLTHELGSVSTWINWIAGVAAAAATVGTYARQWPTSYRRVASWVLIISGVFLASSSASWLAATHLPLLRGRGLGLLILSGVGIALAAVGVLRLARSPTDPMVNALRAIARAVEKHVDRLDEVDGFDSERFIDIGLQQIAGGSRRKRSFNNMLWHASEQVTIVTGDSGSGKTVMLRQLTRHACQKVYSSRNPKRLAIYIDLKDIRTAASELTADTIRSCLQEAIAAGDTALGSHLAQRLREPSNRLKWIIIFDSLDESSSTLKSEQATLISNQYLDAIRQFLSSAGPTFRAVIVTRELNIARNGMAHMIIPPLSHARRRALVRQAPLDLTTQRQLLRRLRNDPSLKEIACNPLLLSLVCDHLRSRPAENLPASLYDIIQVSLTTRFRSLPTHTEDGDVMRTAAHVAYFLATEVSLDRPVDPSRLDAVIDNDPQIVEGAEFLINALIYARICRFELSGVLVFTHPRFQEHFRTSWLLRSWREANIQDLFTNPRWDESIIIGLQIGSEELRSALIKEVDRILAKDVDETVGVVSITSILQISTSEAMPAPTRFFAWPPISLRILQLLAAGLSDQQPLSVEITENIDRLVVNAFAAGMLLDKKRAIDVAVTTSPEVTQWIAHRAAASGKDLLLRAAARLLAVRPHVFALLDLKTRALATIAGSIYPQIIDNTPSSSDRVTSGAPTLAGSIYNLVRVGQVTTIGLVILSLRGLIDLAVNIHSLKHFVEAAPALAAWMILTLSPVAFLATWTDRRRLSLPLVKLAGVIVVIAAALGVLEGVVAVLGAVALISAFRFSTAFDDIVLAYLFTWPAAMATFVFLGPLPTNWDWLVPQIPISRIGIAAIPLFGTHGKTYDHQDMIGRAVKEMRGLALFGLGIGLVIAIVEAPLPVIRHKDVNNVRAALFFALLLIYAAFNYTRKRWWISHTVGQRITGSRLATFSVLQALDEASTQVATERLLKTLRDAPPGVLWDSTDALHDLARALDYVTRMVPREVRSPIPPAVWDVGPSFRLPEFRNWLSKFDERYPGRLSWLAEKHQGLVAETLDRCEIPIEVTGT
jgi:hypothetical protein